MSPERVLQLLATEVRIETDDPDVAAGLDYLVPGAAQDIPVSAQARFSIRRHPDGYALERDGGSQAVLAGTTAVLAALFERVHLAALEGFEDAVRIHAACGRHDGRAFLAVGAKGAGKTSLALRLLFDGCGISGDELVLLHRGQAIAFPRKFYIKEGTLALIPELGSLLERLPLVRDARGSIIRAFEPGDAGLPWDIEPFRPEVVLALEPGHGGSTRVEPFPKFRTVERILSQASLPAHRTADGIREVCTMVDGCRTYLVRVGGLGEAAEAVRQAINPLAPADQLG